MNFILRKYAKIYEKFHFQKKSFEIAQNFYPVHLKTKNGFQEYFYKKYIFHVFATKTKCTHGSKIEF